MTAIHASLIVLMVCCLVAVPLCSVAAPPGDPVPLPRTMMLSQRDADSTSPEAVFGFSSLLRHSRRVGVAVKDSGAWDGIIPGAKCVYLGNAQATAWMYGPVFIVTNPPPTPTHDATWGRIKAAYR